MSIIKHWTEDDDAYLRQHYPGGNLKGIGEYLGRTDWSIRSRAHVLDLKQDPWVRGQHVRAGMRRILLTGNLIPCANPHCKLGDDGKPRLFPEFKTANPKKYCCAACRLKAGKAQRRVRAKEYKQQHPRVGPQYKFKKQRFEVEPEVTIKDIVRSPMGRTADVIERYIQRIFEEAGG